MITISRLSRCEVLRADLGRGHGARSDHEHFGASIEGVVAPVDIGIQVLELDRSNLETMFILAFYDKTGDTSVGNKLEALFECWIGVDVLKDSICRVPVDVVGIFLCNKVT
jgi:hypothetical protein